MEDVKRTIIPTRFRAKISHDLSFPIGAEKISGALSDAPQISSLVLHFKSDRWRNVRFGRYACISLRHSSRLADMAGQFLDSAGIPLFNEWQVDVYPVPKSHRHNIQQNILSSALPEMNAWLRKLAGRQQLGEQTLTFFFDEQKDEFNSEVEVKLHPQRT